MFKSIRWKFIAIYFLLVFIAMIILGVFIMQQFESYHLNTVKDNIDLRANSFMQTLREIDWVNNKQEVQENINYYEEMGMEFFVIEKDKNFSIIASTNAHYLNQNAADILETDLIIKAFAGEVAEKDISPSEAINKTSKNLVYPLYDDDSRIIGALYVRRTLDDIYETLDASIGILIRATFLALFITVILGYLIAKSITGPINDVTIKAEKMAGGDFNQVVEVKSDDEIGQMASMFNYLTAQLNSLMLEMSSEKQKMDTIIKYMADGLVAATARGTIIHANPRALEMLRIKEGSFNHKNFNKLFSNFKEPLTIDLIKGSSKNWSGTQILHMEEGVTIRANYAPYKNDKGKYEGIIVLLQDVTELEKLENMRKEFVANVSHELKTPLTTIKSYTETLLEGALDSRELLLRFLEVIDNEADRMTRLVRDLLQLSNLDFQQAKWNKKPIIINKIIDKAVLKLDVSAQNKQQRIYVEMDENAGTIYADEDKLEQVILNIISNSIKYTPEGGEITIQADKTGEYVDIRIKDNGMGIPEGDLPRIFERFYRVDKARSRELGGTGLGLSIAKEIIDAHEGEIKISSHEGEGTEVILYLPLFKEKAV
ncbi:sensor histidine kinase [Alkaliphilus serpentinus]|uniref:histidine kinase n=1 Tax=Alkaliphilus serpentinus TaxID=1482731 RepID=A0A833MB36_9FIRM|nr:ATP-binding protein [Alkaliphilus serpentinus]KAB3532181.1 cell wall metabolism sensor histidine kinase WalK [Alkaliphilus serpentinus]